MKLYGDLVLRIALDRCPTKEDAEDVAQEVFITLMKRTKPFKDKEHLKAWLIRATVHRSKNVGRYEARHPRSSYDPATHDRIADENSDAETEKIHDAVEKLPSEQRNAIRMYYRDGYSAKEIAEIEGLAESSIRARLHRARNKIAAELVCLFALMAVIGLGISTAPAKLPQALAIDFATATTISVAELPLSSIQESNNGKAIVTVPVTLRWKKDISDTWQLYFSTDAPNAVLYSAEEGNRYVNFGSNENSHPKGVYATNGSSEAKVEIEITVDANQGDTLQAIYEKARDSLVGYTVSATALYQDNTHEVATCTFAK